MAILPHLTDEALTADLTFGKEKGLPGLVVRAEALLPLPAEDRYAVTSLCQVMVNRTPGYRPSDGYWFALGVYGRGGAEACMAEVNARR